MAMQMTGDVVLPASRTQVWLALNDPDILKSCIPGCESFERTGDHSFSALAVAKIGPVKAKFKGNVELTDIDPPNGYTISGQGDGGIAGFAKGAAKVSLSDAEEGGTRLSYAVEAQIGGKLAQLGQRLVDGVAKSMADKFFENIRARLSETAEQA
jgi:carbon monoxide dehydrogenase subunit G